MMSKNSFWASLKENNKRRTWVWIISGLFWFFFYPVTMALLMSRKKNHNLIDELTGAAAKLRLVEEAREWLSMNGIAAFFVSLFAVVCAIQGFSYLYSRKKVDMYHSVPVKRSRRFAVIYINGVLIYLIPYTVSLLMAMVVAAVNGAMDTANAAFALIAWGMNLLLFLGTYGVAILAVMLTGNLIITLFATGILLIYEWVLRGLNYFYKTEFYDYFYYGSVELAPFFSPMGQYLRIWQLLQTDGVSSANTVAAWSGAIGMELLIAVVCAALAYICYRLRPSEAAGKPMAFARTKSVIKFLITVPVILGIAYIVVGVVGNGTNTTAPIVFTLIAASILSNCIIEVIYEVDIKAAFRKKYQILISGGCAALIYCVFCFDLTGFDAWVPKAEQLEDAVVVCSEDTYRNYVDENLKYIDTMDYCLSKPGIKDVEAICELSSRKMQGDDVIYLTVAYRMKNGKTVWREFPVSGTETELLNRVIGSEEYKETAYQLADDAIYQGIRNSNIKEILYDTGFRIENLAVEDFDALREAYVKDLEQVDYSTYREEYSCGYINIEIYRDKGSWIYFEYPVYPSFENTVAFLKEKEIYTERYVDVEEIESITVTNYHNDLLEQAYEQARADGGDEEEIALEIGSMDITVHKTFTDKAQIRELAEAIYPIGFSERWKAPGTISDDYYVTLQYKDGSSISANYRGNNEAQLITEYIPAWLEAETAYK